VRVSSEHAGEMEIVPLFPGPWLQAFAIKGLPFIVNLHSRSSFRKKTRRPSFKNGIRRSKNPYPTLCSPGG
jgi:hypothetical protein